jgi:DNA-binding transcriptional MerR regulator
MDGAWSIGELAELASDVLAAGQTHQVSGRVREIPNDRLIRWYATVGLVDPPLSRSGRIARYGRRHLLQLVAVKRRQADGRSLAEIQAELVGATDDYLEAVAMLPSPGPDRVAWSDAGREANGPAPDDRFWRRHAAAAPTAALAATPATAPAAAAAATRAAPAATRAAAAAAIPPAPPQLSEGAGFMTGIRLGPGVLLLFDADERGPLPADAEDLRAAAAPLLVALARCGYAVGSADQERNQQ